MSRARASGLAAAVAVLALAVLVGPRFLPDQGSADAGPALCREPALVTSQNRTWDDGGFVVDQDLWNNHGGTQVLRACSYRRWAVVATQPDTPDVNTYPNVHRDFDSPRLDPFSEVTSRFAARAPDTGIYDFAYDVWLKGVAAAGATEIMVWTDTHGNEPNVPQHGTFTSGGVAYTVYRAGRYIAFLGPSRRSGTVDLLSFFRYAVARGWLEGSSTIGQIDFGVEICSTDDGPLEFAVTDFALTAR